MHDKRVNKVQMHLGRKVFVYIKVIFIFFNIIRLIEYKCVTCIVSDIASRVPYSQ